MGVLVTCTALAVLFALAASIDAILSTVAGWGGSTAAPDDFTTPKVWRIDP
jgi:hypothetical protein